MMKLSQLVWVGFGLLIVTSGCSRSPCSELVKQTCEVAPGTLACEKATRLSANAECSLFLTDVKKFVELSNLRVTPSAAESTSPSVPRAKDQMNHREAVRAPVAGERDEGSGCWDLYTCTAECPLEDASSAKPCIV